MIRAAARRSACPAAARPLLRARFGARARPHGLRRARTPAAAAARLLAAGGAPATRAAGTRAAPCAPASLHAPAEVLALARRDETLHARDHVVLLFLDVVLDVLLELGHELVEL